MNYWQLAATSTLLTLSLMTVPSAGFAENTQRNGTLDLSPELAVLLKKEMLGLSEGIGEIALALATANWDVIELTSEKIHNSYIMKKSLTPALTLELKQKLPHEFKQLDAQFHARALKLHQAAGVRDFELSAFHFSRLVESCAVCHRAFAVDRFPGFDHTSGEQHEH